MAGRPPLSLDEDALTQQLQRTLGPILIWGLGVGYVISGSYFGWNLGLPEGGPYGLLAATALVTVLYVSFVLGYAELACALPRAGGAFVYASRAFGPKVGFLAGTAQLIEYTLAPPAIAFAIGSYVNQNVPEAPIGAIAFGAYVVFTAINIIGVRVSVTFELVITVLAVLELLVFAFVALPHFTWEKFSLDPLPNGWIGAFAAIPFAMWFYLAIEGIANVAEEAKDPQRDLSRGFLSAIVTLVVLTNIVLFGAVGADGWRTVVYPAGSEVTSDSPLPLAVGHIVGRDHALFTILTTVGLLGLVASFHGILIAASRALLEYGRVGYAPAVIGQVHVRRRTPVAALIATMTIGCIALVTGRTGDIIMLSVCGALTLYLLSTLSLLKLRRSEPDLPRPYKTPLYPVVPVISIVVTVIAMGAMLWTNSFIVGVFLALLGGSYGLFLLLVPKDRRVRHDP
jgi:ethanolamine permease